jgi:transcriptional regulator with XRE-family HTH domain
MEKLRQEFEDTYFAQISSTKGIVQLAEKIGISKNSLRRFLGKLNDGTKPRIATLNMIAESLGYQDFKDFSDNSEEEKNPIDFSVIKIFYESVKGKGVIMGEERFQNVNYELAEKIILDDKNLKHFMNYFYENPEALEYLFEFLKSGKYIEKSNVKITDYSKIPNNYRFIYNIYLADALNLVGRFQEADVLQETNESHYYQEDFENENYHSDTHILFSKISRAITFFKLGDCQKANHLFRIITNELSETKIPFDIKDYFEIQYFYLAAKLYPENKFYQKQFAEIVRKTNFTFFKKF